MKRINPRKGEAQIRTCVLTVILCMLLSVFLTFAYSVNLIRQVERNSRVVLDRYVMTDAIRIYDAIKQGRNTDEELNGERYRTALAEFCTFAKNGNFYYSMDDDGKVRYYISPPTLGYTEQNTLKLVTTYTVYVPVFFAGMQVGTAEVPLTVTSKLNDKF